MVTIVLSSSSSSFTIFMNSLFIMATIFFFITILLLLLSSSSPPFFISAQPEVRREQLFFCGVHDEVINDPFLELMFRPNATVGSAEFPCPLLEISNKNVRQIFFYFASTAEREPFFVNQLVVKNNFLRDHIRFGDHVINSTTATAISSSLSPPSVTLDNVTIDWFRNDDDGVLTAEYVQLIIFQDFHTHSIFIRNCRLIAESRYSPENINDVARTTSAISFLDTQTTGMLEIAENVVQTICAGIMFFACNATGTVRIDSNNISYSDKYDAGVVDGAYQYGRVDTSLLTTDIRTFESSWLNKNTNNNNPNNNQAGEPSHHHLHLPLSIYIRKNNFFRSLRFHRKYDRHMVDLAMKMSGNSSSNGNDEVVISENNLTMDATQMTTAFPPVEGEDYHGAYKLLAGSSTNFSVSRFLITKNHFRSQNFHSSAAIDIIFRIHSMTCGGEDAVFEISENSIDLSMKTPIALSTDFASLTKAQWKKVLDRTTKLSPITLMRMRSCGFVNISSNTITKLEYYRPLVASSYNTFALANDGFPVTSLYVLEFGERFNITKMEISNNKFNVSFEGDRSFYNSLLGMFFQQVTLAAEGFYPRELIIRKNTFNLISDSTTLTTFSFVTSFDDFAYLDKLIVEDNVVDVSRVSFIPCYLCSAISISQLRMLALAAAASGQSEAVEVIINLVSVGSSPLSSLIVVSVSGRWSPLAMATKSNASRDLFDSEPVMVSIRSNIFTASMPTAEDESKKYVITLCGLSDNTDDGTRRKEVLFQNNSMYVRTKTSSSPSFNYLLPSTLLSAMSKRVVFLKMSILDNKHVFVNTRFGTTGSFAFNTLEANIEIRRNQIIREVSSSSAKENNNNNNQQSSSSSSSYYRFVGLTPNGNLLTTEWQYESSSSASPPVSQLVITGSLYPGSRDDPPSASSSGNLIISDNIVDEQYSTSIAHNVLAFFNVSRRSNFNTLNISILNNIVNYSHYGSQDCALISNHPFNSGIDIRNNQMDLTRCERTSSIVSSSAALGTVSNNRISCGSISGGGEGHRHRCLFASLDKDVDSMTRFFLSTISADSLNLTMKSNQITIDKEPECDDEHRYLLLNREFSLSSFNLDVSSDQTATTPCNTIKYVRSSSSNNNDNGNDDQTKILNVSGWNATATINDENCQVLKKCSEEEEEEDKNKWSQTETLFIKKPLGSSSLIVSDEVSAALTTSDVVQSFAMGALAIGSAATPALAFNVGRQQAMMNYAQNALSGDCRGLMPAIRTSSDENDEIENPLAAADSPTRMQIGDSVGAFYVGAVVGNFLLFCGLILLNQLLGHLVTKIIIEKYLTVPNNMKLAVMFSKTKKKQYEEQQNKWKSVSYVFANSFVSLSLFFLIAILLSPTLTSAVVITAGVSNDVVPVGIKILCLILAFTLAGIGVYYVVWSVYLRKPRREEYRIDQQAKNELSKKKELGLLDLFKSYCKPDGEWKIPTNKRTEKETHEFLISDSCYQSYRKNQWFAIVEIVTGILVCFPPLFAQFASSGKSSCIIQGSLLLIILVVYMILLIWKNPKKLKMMRIVAPLMAIQQTITVGMTLIAVVTREEENTNNNNNGKAEEEAWLWKSIFVPLGLEVVFGVFSVMAAVFPFIRFLQKLKMKIDKAKQQFSSSTTTTTSRQQQHDSPSSRRHHHQRDYNNDDDDQELSLIAKERPIMRNDDYDRRGRRDDDRSRRDRSRHHHHHHHDRSNTHRRHSRSSDGHHGDRDRRDSSRHLSSTLSSRRDYYYRRENDDNRSGRSSQNNHYRDSSDHRHDSFSPTSSPRDSYYSRHRHHSSDNDYDRKRSPIIMESSNSRSRRESENNNNNNNSSSSAYRRHRGSSSSYPENDEYHQRRERRRNEEEEEKDGPRNSSRDHGHYYKYNNNDESRRSKVSSSKDLL